VWSANIFFTVGCTLSFIFIPKIYAQYSGEEIDLMARSSKYISSRSSNPSSKSKEEEAESHGALISDSRNAMGETEITQVAQM